MASIIPASVQGAPLIGEIPDDPMNIRKDPVLLDIVRHIVQMIGTCEMDLCELTWWLREEKGYRSTYPDDVQRIWFMYRDVPELGPAFPVGEEKKFRWEYERKIDRLWEIELAKEAEKEAAEAAEVARGLKKAKKPKKPIRKEPVGRRGLMRMAVMMTAQKWWEEGQA